MIHAVEPERRWRVTLTGVDSAPFGDDPAAYFVPRDKALAAVARRQPDRGLSLSLSYEQHGPDVFISLNVTAADAKSAEDLGAALLVNDLPATLTLRSVVARPLLAEPDFT
jgi:hypothetical protein